MIWKWRYLIYRVICLSCEKQLSVGANCIIIMHISCQHNVLVVDFLNAFNITVYFFPISFLFLIFMQLPSIWFLQSLPL